MISHTQIGHNIQRQYKIYDNPLPLITYSWLEHNYLVPHFPKKFLEVEIHSSYGEVQIPEEYGKQHLIYIQFYKTLYEENVPNL